MNKAEMIVLAKQAARKAALDPALICAIIERESQWDPHAVRLENGFYRRYMRPLVESGTVEVSEAVLRSTSFGLGQTMLESLRELGFAGRPEDLIIPAAGAEWLCHLFSKKLAAAHGSVTDALSRYNGGSNPKYPGQVLALKSKYE